MKLNQLFFIEATLRGQAERELVYVHNERRRPMSGLYFCSECGEVWAKCPVVGDDGVASPWQSYRTLCRKCFHYSKTMFQVPGSLTLSWDKDFMQALPMPVLAWELDRHLDHYERVHSGY